MANNLNFEFLRLEFKELYDKIILLMGYKEKDNLLDETDKLIEDLIFQIYKKNKILFDDKLDNRNNLRVLNKINLLPIDIMRKIYFLLEEINYYYAKPEILKEDDEADYFYGKYQSTIYEIFVWFVINNGEENYSLIVDSLDDNTKKIFNKYLSENINNEINKNVEAQEETYLSKEDIKKKAAEYVEIGEKYYFGKGVKKNNKEAFKKFIIGAKLGNEYAQAYLGLFYEKGIAVRRDYLMASKWYVKSAVKGNSFAQYSLGVLLLNGDGVKKSYEKAILWMQKSAENDYVPAYYQLGRIYYNGLGVEKNLTTAFKWYSKAAEEDLGAAQHALSFMYKQGEGCEKNITKAYYWVERAAENEYEDAYYIVGKSYLEGIYFDVNYEKAYYYLAKGYEELDTNCIEALGDMYYKGLHVEKNILRALELYIKSIDYGNKGLYFKVGKIYEDQGLVKQALAYYNKGHEKGDIKSTQRLGIMYYNGEGVSRDLDKSIKYMEKAAESKAPHAMYVLGVAYLRLNKFGDKTTEISSKILEEAYSLESQYAAEYLAYLMLNDKREGKEINEDKLLEYIKFGVEKGLTDSIFQYGYIYDKGIAVEQDQEKAYYYYNLAAEKKSVKAMIKLGDWYKRGKFLAQNIDLALNWYEEAAELNDIEAIEKTIEIYELGIGGRKDERNALYYVFKLIDVDAIKGKQKLVYYCMEGLGVEMDVNKGNELIEEIKEIDKGSANYIIGYLAEKGLMNIGSEEIIALYQEGIELGNLECYGRLAKYLYDNKLYNKKKYKELFETAMGGKDLGVNECKYIYLKEALKEKQKNELVTIEEILIVRKLNRLVDKGIYEGLNDLLKWYRTRRKNDKINIAILKQKAAFYNVDLNKKNKNKAAANLMS